MEASRKDFTFDCARLNGDLYVATVRGELDVSNVEAFEQRVAEAARSADGRLLLDLSSVAYVDSSVVGALIGARRRGACNAFVALVLPGQCGARRLLNVARVLGLFQVYDSLGAALAELQPSDRRTPAR